MQDLIIALLNYAKLISVKLLKKLNSLIRIKHALKEICCVPVRMLESMPVVTMCSLFYYCVPLPFVVFVNIS